MCATPKAFQTIENNGIFIPVIDIIGISEQTSFCLEVLSDISLIENVNLESWIRQGIIHKLDCLLIDSDVRTKESALFFVGVLCANASAYKHISKDSLNTLFNSAFSKADSIATAAIHGVAVAFSREFGQEHVEFLHDLFTTLQQETNGQLFDRIMARARSCIPEDKSAAYFLLSNLVSHQFIIQSPDTNILTSFLLDRQSDTSTEGMKWKYGIIEALHRQPWFTQVFPEDIQIKMIDYLRAGVVFIGRQSRIAFEHQ